ncbi:MAG: FHA domain-containing protein [Acinetobacter sp.]|nr:FHA domain-containing protein [Acinetobacter sp.]
MVWQLTAQRADSPNITMQHAQCIVGGHRSADVILPFPHISRHHARLRIDEQQLLIQDLHSAQGTWLNGQKIEQECVLQANDQVAFADLMYHVEWLADDVVAPVEHIASTAEQMSEQGMLSLQERAGDIHVSRDGMPTNMSIPKPAPIPEGVDVFAKQAVQYTAQDDIKSDVALHKEEKRNASIGLLVIVLLVIVAAVAAWVLI